MKHQVGYNQVIAVFTLSVQLLAHMTKMSWQFI